jgi:hypothetical protein
MLLLIVSSSHFVVRYRLRCARCRERVSCFDQKLQGNYVTTRTWLAESIYFGEEGRRRRTEQIVLVGQIAIEGAAVKWALTRMEG